MRLAIVAAVALLPSLIVTVPVLAQTSSPDRNDCESAIDRWQDFAAKESQGGHMDDSVFNAIKTEIEQATEVCRSGQDARASKMVEASMRRHGY